MASSAPDSDTIKMFVGQIPKSWSEEDVRFSLTEFGPIYSASILRDKVTRQSKGCCFVTFYKRKSALDAQNGCHNIRVLPGMSHPMQMKPADNENRHERKIFVGMLTKSLKEDDLRQLFLSFGLIEEVSILRDGNGVSRGCGFVTFATKASALKAIKNMHQSTVMEGCSSPIVVKIADVQQKGDNSLKIGPLKNRSASGPLKTISEDLYMRLLQCILYQPELFEYNFLANQMSPFQNETTLNLTTALLSTTAGNLGHDAYGLLPYLKNWNFLNLQSNPLSEALLRSVVTPPVTSGHGHTAYSTEALKGSVLYIHHLPLGFSETDLISLFSPFGLIIFVRVVTELPKCYGIVSYDNFLSAQLAIQALDGLPIGSKRLRVQFE